MHGIQIARRSRARILLVLLLLPFVLFVVLLQRLPSRHPPSSDPRRKKNAEVRGRLSRAPLPAPLANKHRLLLPISLAEHANPLRRLDRALPPSSRSNSLATGQILRRKQERKGGGYRKAVIVLEAAIPIHLPPILLHHARDAHLHASLRGRGSWERKRRTSLWEWWSAHLTCCV